MVSGLTLVFVSLIAGSWSYPFSKLFEPIVAIINADDSQGQNVESISSSVTKENGSLLPTSLATPTSLRLPCFTPQDCDGQSSDSWECVRDHREKGSRTPGAKGNGTSRQARRQVLQSASTLSEDEMRNLMKQSFLGMVRAVISGKSLGRCSKIKL